MLHLGSPDHGFAQRGLAKEGACKSILFTESSCVVKKKNTWLITFVYQPSFFIKHLEIL